MKDDSLQKIALDVTLLSLVAIGGANAILPDMHRQVVDVSHWMSDQEFANIFAMGQVAPGPNIMVLSLIGWRIAGFAGFVVASLAAIVPTCLLAGALGLFIRRFGASVWFEIIRDALRPLAIGLVLASGLVMAQAADHNALMAIATLTTAGLTAITSINPLYPMGGFAALACLQAGSQT